MQTPDWHDRPNCPGLWMAALYQVPHWPDLATKYETWRVAKPDMFANLYIGARWYGPIPEDTKRTNAPDEK